MVNMPNSTMGDTADQQRYVEEAPKDPATLPIDARQLRA